LKDAAVVLVSLPNRNHNLALHNGVEHLLKEKKRRRMRTHQLRLAAVKHQEAKKTDKILRVH
jgi:hypothetical protein